MKKLHLLIAAFLVISAHGANAQDATAAVERLRTAYTAAVKRATDPLTETYRQELNKLLDHYTKSGKQADALTVKNELAALGAAPAASPSATHPAKDSKPAEDAAASGHKLTKRQFERNLLKNKWLIGERLDTATALIPATNECVFTEDGNFTRTDGTGQTHGWRLTNDGDLILYTEASERWGVKVTQNRDGTLTPTQTGNLWPKDKFFRMEIAPSK